MNSSGRAKIEARRKNVAEALLAGMTISKIAEQSGVHKSQISRDAKVILEQWREDRNFAADGIAQIENARLERAMQSIWPNVVSGDLLAIDRMIRIMERKAKLLGLDKPTLSNHEVTSKLSEEELLACILE